MIVLKGGRGSELFCEMFVVGGNTKSECCLRERPKRERKRKRGVCEREIERMKTRVKVISTVDVVRRVESKENEGSTKSPGG